MTPCITDNRGEYAMLNIFIMVFDFSEIAISKEQWEEYFEHLYKKEPNSEHSAWINGNEDNTEITIGEIH